MGDLRRAFASSLDAGPLRERRAPLSLRRAARIATRESGQARSTLTDRGRREAVIATAVVEISLEGEG